MSWPWWGCPGHSGGALAVVGMPSLWWGCPGHSGDALAMVGMPWLWWGCPGHGGDALAMVGMPWPWGDALAMVGMPWPCIPQARTASPPLSALGMGHGHRSRGSVGEQWLGRDCCVTWGVPSSQLGLMQGSGISLSHAA